MGHFGIWDPWFPLLESRVYIREFSLTSHHMSRTREGLGIQRNRKQQKYSNSLTHPGRTSVAFPSLPCPPPPPHSCIPVGGYPLPEQAVSINVLVPLLKLYPLPKSLFPSSSPGEWSSSFRTSSVVELALPHRVILPGRRTSLWFKKLGMPIAEHRAGQDCMLKTRHSFDRH